MLNKDVDLAVTTFISVKVWISVDKNMKIYRCVHLYINTDVYIFLFVPEKQECYGTELFTCLLICDNQPLGRVKCFVFRDLGHNLRLISPHRENQQLFSMRFNIL